MSATSPELCREKNPEEPPNWAQHLLVVLQLVLQDDAVGLVGLGPGQGDAGRASVDLVDDGHR